MIKVELPFHQIQHKMQIVICVKTRAVENNRRNRPDTIPSRTWPESPVSNVIGSCLVWYNAKIPLPDRASVWDLFGELLPDPTGDDALYIERTFLKTLERYFF